MTVTLKVCFSVFAFRADSVTCFEWDGHVEVGVDESVEFEFCNADRRGGFG